MVPGNIDPPYIKIDGLSSLAIAIRHPGIFLSQPPIVITPSNPSAAETVSIESAITSLDIKNISFQEFP